ncbi:Thymocyte nuclear protein 1 [Sciurus carolinensis]|uniref:Thymocyte nuclear protein 1 n=1 Tax=Sciurus carolinensis TaxID=30640 RepID=A0AA41NA75_SCICA|nr:Thymocyte nuclear protein 1 [Sciurus carolinensis]
MSSHSKVFFNPYNIASLFQPENLSFLPLALEPPMLCEAWTLVEVYSPVTSKPSKKVLVEIVTEIQKHTKSENLGEASAKVENSSLQKTSAFKKCGRTLSNYRLMKSEPESRLDKGVDVKFSTEDLKAQPKQTACWDGV